MPKARRLVVVTHDERYWCDAPRTIHLFDGQILAEETAEVSRAEKE